MNETETYSKMSNKDFVFDELHFVDNGILSWRAMKKIARMYYQLKATTIKSDVIASAMYVIENALQSDNVLGDGKREKLHLWCLGFKEIEIAERLNVTQQYVNTCLKQICKTLVKQVKAEWLK